MYLDVRHKPLTVHAVEVKGDERTRPGLFARVLAPVYRAGTLDELRVRCLEANAVLSSYGIFDRVDILCDAGPEEHPDTADVVVEVVEKKKLNLKGGAYVSQSGEGSMEMSAGLNNALGFAEKLDVEVRRARAGNHVRLRVGAAARFSATSTTSPARLPAGIVFEAAQQFRRDGSRRLGHRGGQGGPARLEYPGVSRDRGSHAAREQGHPTPARALAEIVHRVHHRRGHARRAPRDPRAGTLYRFRSELAGIGADPRMYPLLQAGG